MSVMCLVIRFDDVSYCMVHDGKCTRYKKLYFYVVCIIQKHLLNRAIIRLDTVLLERLPNQYCHVDMLFL